MEGAFHKSSKDVLSFFSVKESTGLSPQQVEENLKKYGKNEMPEPEKTPLWKMIMEQFEDNLVRILLLAAVISFVLALFEEGEDSHAFVEPFVILLILIANACVGIYQESSAEAAIEALKQYAPDEAKVIRNEKLSKIVASELVPGDIVEIAVGDKIPADLRLLSILSTTLTIDESILTGETVSKFKQTEPISDARATIQDKSSMLFSGTTVTSGKGRAVVALTGSRTAIGQISKNIAEAEQEKTPLKKKLDDFGDELSKYIGVICVLVWIINFRHFNDPIHGGYIQGAIYYFKIAVALAVAAIPEGLPAVITTCLALGTMKMAKKNAIVRSLPSVETLGSTTVICSDKTGTLTTNKMSTCKAMVFGNSSSSITEYDISGSSYAPTGEIKSNSAKVTFACSNPVVNELVQICSICNESKIVYNETNDSFDHVGEPTEAALRVLVEKFETNSREVNNILSTLNKSKRVQACNNYISEQFTKVATLEFSRDRKSMSVLCKSKDGKNVMFVKGAPENVLERCTSVRFADGKKAPMTEETKNAISKTFLDWGTTKTLRCLALATRDDPVPADKMNFSDPKNFATYESNLTFIGMVGMLDPPRDEVYESIQTCYNAGIRVIVITGDNKNTAESICRKIGIFGENEDLKGKSFTGREYDDLSDKQKN